MSRRRPFSNRNSNNEPSFSFCAEEIQSVDSSGPLFVKQIAQRAWKSPKVKLSIVLWMFGLFFMYLSPAWISTSPERKAQHASLLQDDPKTIRKYHEIYQSFAVAEETYETEKVWFWRFREPYRTRVLNAKKKVDFWEEKLHALDAQKDAKTKQAKQLVGLFSEFGIHEIRERFWNAFEKGKMFAKQQTFYHMVVHLLSGKQEELWSTLFNWIFIAIMNFTTGLLGSLFYFLFSLIHMIYTFQPDPVSGVAFFLVGMIGATSVIVSYLAVVYGMVASSIYVVGKMAIRGALRDAQEERRRVA